MIVEFLAMYTRLGKVHRKKAKKISIIVILPVFEIPVESWPVSFVGFLCFRVSFVLSFVSDATVYVLRE